MVRKKSKIGRFFKAFYEYLREKCKRSKKEKEPLCVPSGATESSVNLFSFDDSKFKRFKKCIFFLLLFLCVILLFIFFLWKIFVLYKEGLSYIGFLLLSSIDFVFIACLIRLFKYRNWSFSKDDKHLKIFIFYVIIIFALFGFFTYVFFVGNTELYLKNINYATSNPLTLLIPILFLIYLFLPLLKMLIKDTGKTLDELIEFLRHRRYDDDYSRIWYKLNSFPNYTILIICLCLIFFSYFEFGMISIVICTSLIVFLFFLFFYKFGDFCFDFKYRIVLEKRQVTRKIKEEQPILEDNFLDDNNTDLEKNSNKKSFHTKKDFKEKVKDLRRLPIRLNPKRLKERVSIFHVIIFLLCILCIILYFSRPVFKKGIDKLINVIIPNPIMLALVTYVFVIFAFIPFFILILRPFLWFAKKIYEKGLGKFVKSAFVYIIALFFIRVFIFNLQKIPLDSIWITIISAILSAVVAYLSNKLRAFKNLLS